jgi:Mg-chelatase subunit ChlD
VAQSPAGTSQEDLNNLAQSFFAANYPSGEIGTPTANVSVSVNDGVFRVSAEAEVDTLLLRIVGKDKITVEAVAEITRETKGLEVVLALDNTGSMSGFKLRALQQATNDLVDILFGDETRPETLFVGIVPFSAMVNIGRENARLLTNLDERLYQPHVWDACVKARFGNRDRTDDPPERERWRPYLADSNFFNRFDQFVRPRIVGSRGERRGPNRNCPEALLPLTNDRTRIEAKINSMVARGVTHINLGAVWAWRVISPGEPFTEGRPYSDETFNKAVIIMTDGNNVTASSFFPFSAYDVGTVGTFQLNGRLLEVCEAMREEGILVYTITFGFLSQSTVSLMRDCAGGEARFFNSPSPSDLQSSFQSIGAELSNLRVSR